MTLQDAMRKAEAAGNADCPVKIKLVAPPLYVLTTQTLDKVSLILRTILGWNREPYMIIDLIYFFYYVGCCEIPCASPNSQVTASVMHRENANCSNAHVQMLNLIAFMFFDALFNIEL